MKLPPARPAFGQGWRSRYWRSSSRCRVAEPAVVEAGVDAHVRSERHHAAGQRHVLVVGAVGGGAAGEEPGRRVVVLGDVAGVVVVHLVVVPDHGPGAARVGRLEVRVGAVEGVVASIVLQGHRLGGPLGAHETAAPARLINVVPEVQEQIQLVRRHVAVGGEVTLGVVLAGADADTHPRRQIAGGGRRAQPADGARGVGVVEAVPVVPPRLQADGLHVHGMAPFRRRIGGAGGCERTKAQILGDLPAHRHRVRRHAAAGGEGFRREPGPKHAAVGAGIAGGDAEGERIGLEAVLRAGRRGEQRRRTHRRQGRQGTEQIAPAPSVSVFHGVFLQRQLITLQACSDYPEPVAISCRHTPDPRIICAHLRSSAVP
jgi:hypothetical protein